MSRPEILAKARRTSRLGEDVHQLALAVMTIVGQMEGLPVQTVAMRNGHHGTRHEVDGNHVERSAVDEAQRNNRGDGAAQPLEEGEKEIGAIAPLLVEATRLR